MSFSYLPWFCTGRDQTPHREAAVENGAIDVAKERQDSGISPPTKIESADVHLHLDATDWSHSGASKNTQHDD